MNEGTGELCERASFVSLETVEGMIQDFVDSSEWRSSQRMRITVR